MKTAVIGAGQVGQTLGGRWSETGHEVAFGVRDVSDSKSRVRIADAAPRARIVSNEEAAQWAEVVAFSTPWSVTEEAVAQCGDLAGKVVLDCTNPVKLGATDEMLELGFDTSAGEMVTQWAKGAAVYKTLNQVLHPHD